MKLTKILLLVLCCLLVVGVASAKKGQKGACVTIQDGTLTYPTGHYLEGQPLKVGYDACGDNYQAHTFNGSYFNSYAGEDGYPPYEGDDDAYLAENPGAESYWAWPYRNIQLAMKWNDAWLSNKDCDGDGLLDRHYGFGSYIGSGAWLTNHQSGTDVITNNKGKEKQVRWTYFIKIVAAPADAVKVDGVWYAADGTEIGPVIWDSFAVIQCVYNNRGTGDHGIEYLSPAGPGFGKYAP